MHNSLAAVLDGSSSKLGTDGIYTAPMPGAGRNQETEKVLREQIAADEYGDGYDDYLAAIARSHSIPVMDHEVDRFLLKMPTDALILDIGGCWGWHWRRLQTTRPDAAVMIIDFVRGNLMNARRLLGSLVGRNIALMHADAISLPFGSAGDERPGFDGVWTVQVFQHIPDFERACSEAFRVLNTGGLFINYSLNPTPLNRIVFRLFGKPFHTEGIVRGKFLLSKANSQQKKVIKDVFRNETVRERYTECLFHPDLRFSISGRPGSRIGQVDARIGSVPWLGRLIGRQCSFEVNKG